MPTSESVICPLALSDAEAQLWRTSFATACLMNHLDTSENRSTEDYASSVADRTLLLYRKVCEARLARAELELGAKSYSTMADLAAAVLDLVRRYPGTRVEVCDDGNHFGWKLSLEGQYQLHRFDIQAACQDPTKGSAFHQLLFTWEGRWRIARALEAGRDPLTMP